MRFGSVCSGIEAASVAWEPLGWKAAWFSEIEPFPCSVLKHHYPDVPNYGDMSTLADRIRAGEVEAPDLFCGGTPCQAFSVAGLRRSLDDERGNLSLVFCEVANAIDAVRSARGEHPAIVFWENVPGVLNTADNAFGCFLAGLAGETVPLEPAGNRWTNAGAVLGPARAVAWRVLDAQHFGVAQRRRRVFVVASARDDFDCAAVLFEREGVRRDFAPSRTKGEIAPTIPSRSTSGGGLGTNFDCDGGLIGITGISSGSDPHTVATLCATDADKWGSNQWVNEGKAIVAHAFDARHSDVCQYGNLSSTLDTDGHTTGILFDSTQITSPSNGSNPQLGDPCHPLTACGHVPAIAFQPRIARNGRGNMGNLVNALQAQSGQSGRGDAAPCVATLQAGLQVRRLTPRECERLQGFPDDYTLIPFRNKPASACPDGPRYKALGNSWAVPVVRWIGQRIAKEVSK